MMFSRSDQIMCCLSLPTGKSGVLIVDIDEGNLQIPSSKQSSRINHFNNQGKTKGTAQKKDG